ncbi:MAG: hypothetical protein A2X19_08725 [Bacteroidetes bacterium GWE2_39_28]|nr:MAG: hypothetical protein A2X19_08725 [Bacteroidetes bacterium GWE2_39_28]OFY12205.1 MAG: hypothetical protein A2X16_06570 [Bacteroidetes bacterium GWF2_39_10]OFZ07954.1 MAG: hypothetical protein A2322_08450 [Bacteroidetes bacterium RIFOXYB2_FULL_39_7]OFZ12317.1 MAG: hypothetical protein A2465_10710 [Bacteroidetes bacterium RIFOXYC2_FULL_39_11]HCT94235.1 hypothetical protein [Rikenellaceae bacterium]
MKKVLIIMFVALLCPYLAAAQAKQIHLILDKYEKRKKVESIIISPSVLQMASNGNYDASTKELLSKISEMRIVNVKEGAEQNGTPLKIIIRSDLDKVLTGERFSRVLKMQDGEELLELFVTKNEEGVLVFLATSPKEFAIISIFGNIDKSVINAVMTGGIKVK